LRILVVTQDFPPITGGIQSYMGDLCEHLRPRCESLAVVAPGGAKEARTDSVKPFPVCRIPIHSSWLVAPLLARLPGLVERFDATHVIYAQWFPAIAGIRLPKTIHQTAIVHGRELLNHPLGSLGLRLAAPVLRRMDAVIPNSFATAALVPGAVGTDRIHVVHPGVDAARHAPPAAEDLARFLERQNLTADVPLVTTLARLVPRKGIDTLIASMHLLRKTRPTATLLVGGSGPDLDRLGTLAKDAGLGDAVRFVGRIPAEDMSAFFACGVFALLSRQTERDVEGFGMVLVEAQACGAPVVAARSGGMPEAVGPGAGRVVAPDSPTETSRILAELLGDPEKRVHMGIQGRAFAKTLSWETRADAFVEILGRVGLTAFSPA
jgi:phosphatidyl-myo-inositol dimannoside synthase